MSVNGNSNKRAEKALKKNKWITSEIDGMRLIFSPLLGEYPLLTHTFTTRIGGTTRAPYDWFNLGRSVGDDDVKRDAMSNRKKLCTSLAVNFHDLVVPGQVHSLNVEVVHDHKEDHVELLDLRGVDGIVTKRERLPLLLHFADCVPVIVFEPKAKVIGIFHAGWRGTAGNIVSNGVRIMAKKLGADPAFMLGAVGPAIGSCCYQTGEDVSLALKKTIDDGTALAAMIGEIDGRPAPDLKAFNAMQLLEAGVGEVDVSDFCTACNPSTFYSHRQSKGTTGRQGALVSLME